MRTARTEDSFAKHRSFRCTDELAREMDAHAELEGKSWADWARGHLARVCGYEPTDINPARQEPTGRVKVIFPTTTKQKK